MIKILLEILSIVIGGTIGWWLLPIFDKIAYIYILHPEAQISQYLKYEIGKRQLKTAWQTMKLRKTEFDKLTTRGILFQAVWLVLVIFVLTSTASLLGKALVIGLGLRILFEEVKEYLKDKNLLKQHLFWQVKREISEKELRAYLITKIVLVILCLLLVR